MEHILPVWGLLLFCLQFFYIVDFSSLLTILFHILKLFKHRGSKENDVMNCHVPTTHLHLWSNLFNLQPPLLVFSSHLIILK